VQAAARRLEHQPHQKHADPGDQEGQRDDPEHSSHVAAEVVPPQTCLDQRPVGVSSFGPRRFMFLFSLLGVSPIDVFAELARVGVDYDDVVATLETDGVKTFLQSFTELLEGVRAKMHDTRGA
jgi:hypothetical protein